MTSPTSNEQALRDKLAAFALWLIAQLEKPAVRSALWMLALGVVLKLWPTIDRDVLSNLALLLSALFGGAQATASLRARSNGNA